MSTSAVALSTPFSSLSTCPRNPLFDILQQILNTRYMPLSNSFTTVTPLSKFLAMLLFIALPFVGFYLGQVYGKSSVQQQKTGSCMTATTPTATCATQKVCSEEAKECPDGSFVFRQQPNCDYALCPSLKETGGTVPAKIMPKNGTPKETQITAQLSQKTSIPQLDLIITYKNDPQVENTYDGGTYANKKGGVSGRWIGTKINGSWVVTSIGSGIPLCSEINQYYYPKELVPACKDAKDNITAR